MKRIVVGIMVVLLLTFPSIFSFASACTGMVTLAFHSRPIEAESSSQQCQMGMISYWKFDEGEGITAYDSADANDGTLVNGPVWTTGKIYDALNFDGVDDFVGLDDNPSLDITNEITMEAWINIDSFPTDEMQILCKGRYDFWRWGISVMRPTKVRALIRTGEIDFFDSNAALSIGVWHHVAVTYNGSIKIIYVDGNEEGSVSAGGNISTDDYPLYIGNRYAKAEVDFNGTIDEVAIYNRALTPVEIQQHYNNGLMGQGYCGVDWWPMFHHDLNHAGYSTSTAPNTNTTLWNYTTGAYVMSSPAVADGKVYVGSNDHKMYCLNALTGTQIWNYTTGNWVCSSPAFADGKIYVGSDDHKVYCLDALTGTHIWNYTTGEKVFSSPAVADGKVYVGSGNGPIYCLNATTGTKIWNYTAFAIGSSPAIAYSRVYVLSTYDQKIYCLNATTGAYIWNYTPGGISDVVSSPAVADGKVYVGSAGHKVYCVDALTGTHIWNYTTGDGVYSSPAVAYGRVYVGSADHKVYCVDALTGTHIWNYTTGEYLWSSPAVADGKVYIGSGDGLVYCLNATTGTKIWSYTTGLYVDSSPAVADGKVYIGSNDHKVYCFGSLVCDVAATNITLYKSVICQEHLSNITVTVENQGDTDETFDVTLYADNATEIIIGVDTIFLASGDSTDLVFDWDTSGFSKGNYTIIAEAEMLPGEVDTADNRYEDEGIWMIVAMEGDITGPSPPTPGWPDGTCDMRDVGLVARYFGQDVPPAPAICDLTGPTQGVPDGTIDMRDVGLVARHFGETDP